MIERACKYGHVAGWLANSTCRECDRLRKRGWRLNNRTAVRDYNVEYRNENRAAAILQMAKRRAGKKNVPYDLDAHVAHYQKIIDAGLCELTGLPFELDARAYRGPYSPSIDRVKPELGYVHGNVRIILWALNAAFATWGEEAYAVIARRYLQSFK